MIRVFIADDHEIVREGLRKVLASASDITIVGEAVDGRAALTGLEKLDAVDVLILDLSLPKVSGVEVLRRARELHPLAAVLVLSMYPEEQYAPRLLDLGAAGYVSKSRPAQDVLRAVRAVAGGERYFSEETRQRLQNNRAKAPHDSLSAREYQVFMLLLQGRSTTEIAAELNVNASTVSNHVTAVRTKLGANTVADVVRYAAREGLIDDRK